MRRAGCFGWVAFFALLGALLVVYYLYNLTMM